MKKRNPNSMETSKGKTYRFYLPNKLYDSLVQEAAAVDIAISRLLRNKLELLEKISFLVNKK